MHPDELYLGMKFSELISAMGLVFGPIAAVVISQALEHFRRRRDERTHILRFLLATRATPADTNYVGAINLIPVYFNRHEKVMAAWHSYMNAVRYSAQPGDEAVQNQQFAAKQTALIFAIMQALKLKLS
ncbi:MAG TPA: DUF6680 family protein, partial [Rhizomicrobium sp.]|nr:DUF6680 family protein [Rhizomicrobium sp.]